MLKIFDSEYNFLLLLDSYKQLYITEALDTGTKSLCFKVPCNDINLESLQEEGYVETADYKYVIKELLLEDNQYVKVYCGPAYQEISGKAFLIFDCFEITPANAYQYCLANTGWTLNYQSQNNTVITKQTEKTMSIDAIREIAEEQEQELWFDTKTKTLSVFDNMGADIGAYFSNELNLKLLVKQSNSYDYATVLYPYGKDGLNIKVVNNNKEYLENYSYSNKFIEKIWIDEECEVADELKHKAERYLAEISMPRASYKLQLAQLGISVAVGDTIIIVDKIKRIRQKQRVIKIIRYPVSPELDTVEISNLQEDFANQFVKSQKKTEADIKYLRELIKSLQ